MMHQKFTKLICRALKFTQKNEYQQNLNTLSTIIHCLYRCKIKLTSSVRSKRSGPFNVKILILTEKLIGTNDSSIIYYSPWGILRLWLRWHGRNPSLVISKMIKHNKYHIQHSLKNEILLPIRTFCTHTNSSTTTALQIAYT